MSQISFVAYLKAAPQGSKVHVGRGRMIESSKAVKPYRHALAQIALMHRGPGFPVCIFHEPIGLTVDFYFLRPASAKKRKYPSVKPDLDKLVRATLDSLTGILYDDDSQVIEINARKHYCTVERVEISCYTLSPSATPFQKGEVTCEGRASV